MNAIDKLVNDWLDRLGSICCNAGDHDESMYMMGGYYDIRSWFIASFFSMGTILVLGNGGGTLL